jgi:hypothetical protein
MASKLLECRKIYACHGHTSQCRVPKIVQSEGWNYFRTPNSTVMGSANIQDMGSRI